MPNITKVYLLAVPLEKDYAHTLYFSSAADQQSYFQSKIKKSYTDFSYQRKDDVIRIPDHIDNLIAAGCNYAMYQNAAYSNRWFYAFIEDMEYVNDGCTNVKIRTDCIQTWMFDIAVKPSFVEREHAATDNAGDNTLEEGLELGAYVCNLHNTAEYGGDGLSIVIGATKKPDGENVTGTLYNNIYSGVRYYSFGTGDMNVINEFLAEYDKDGIGEAITCMFMAPRWLAPLRDDHIVAGTNLTYDYYINSESQEVSGVQKNLTKGTVDGYAPRNKKLLTYPFRYLLVSNNAGASVPFKYERFRKEEYDEAGNIIRRIVAPCFVIEGVLNPGCSIRMVPLYYNGIYRNDEEGVNMGKFPALNWTSDVYTNWLTQNGVNIAIQMVSGVGQIVAGAAIAAGTGGLATAVGGGSIVGGVSQVAGTLSQIYQQSFAPPQAKGNLNSGDVVTATERNDFHFYDMTIKAEYAKIIDEYFDMYGYKCHRVKIPEKAHRAAYWYTKTIDANIIGNIPQNDLQVIKDCYNRGITFWRNTTNFKNYSAANGIVGVG